MEKDAIPELLKDQYSSAIVTILNEDLPPVERIFYRAGIENLIRITENLDNVDTLILERVRLDRNFKPIAMEWSLKSDSEKTAKLEKEGKRVVYSYLIEGDHGEVGATTQTQVVKSEDLIETGETIFAEVLAQYDRANNEWSGQDEESNDKEIIKEASPEDIADLAILEALMILLPEGVSELMENSWTNVQEYDEAEVGAEGREVVEISESLQKIFCLTRESTGDEGEYAYVFWMKPRRVE
jgi:hypothetical protein